MEAAIPQDLLLELERLYAPKRPTINQSIEEIFLNAGKVALVEELRAHYNLQQRYTLEKEVHVDVFVKT